ncbi:MAG: DsrE/DsrF/DrsH-like family protein [Bacteroidales bacterium]|nr:DsrE/DsrF/DrsH-like family protein [Bacteroidales bacterium]
MSKMVIGLSSGSVDKLVGTGVIMSGAAADDMDVEVYVLLTAARAFIKGNEDLTDSLVEYPHLKSEFFANMEKLAVPTWLEFFEQAKEFTDVKIYICSLAGKLWGGEKKEDFIDIVDGLCGIGQYIDAAKEADIHINI